MESDDVQSRRVSCYRPTVLVLTVSVSTLAVIAGMRGSALAESGFGALEGIVRLAGGGEVPSPTMVANTTDPAVCGQLQTLDDLLVSNSNRGVQHVLVTLTDVPKEKIPPLQPHQLILDNRGCRFVPHVSVLTVGSTIKALNSDPVLHTVHLYGAVEANLALPAKRSRVTKAIAQQGMIIVRCDVHGWMRAFIQVDDHPFHAVSDATGSFRIAHIPAGTYHLEAWHERLQAQKKTIHIEAGQTAWAEIVYPLTP